MSSCRLAFGHDGALATGALQRRGSSCCAVPVLPKSLLAMSVPLSMKAGVGTSTSLTLRSNGEPSVRSKAAESAVLSGAALIMIFHCAGLEVFVILVLRTEVAN